MTFRLLRMTQVFAALSEVPPTRNASDGHRQESPLERRPRRGMDAGLAGNMTAPLGADEASGRRHPATIRP
jgi:hypothetical protein